MKKLLFCLLIYPAFLCARTNPEELWTHPWFTGPLFAPSASTNPVGIATYQPYLFVTNQFGEFDKHWKRRGTPNTWTIQPLVDITYGIASFLDLEVTPAFSYTMREGSSSVRMNDTPLFLGIQALRDTPGTAIPDLRITIRQLFPFGQYDKLNPKKHETDASGGGSYRTGIAFNFQKLFRIAAEKYFRLRWSVGTFFYSTPVHIQGRSVYGGASNTSGRVFLGQSYNAFLSGEYTITRNWGFAFDTLYTLNRHDRFTGKRGTDENGEKARVGQPISQQISFAPAVEYNYSENFGLIGGFWFTLAGRSSAQFISGVISAVVSF